MDISKFKIPTLDGPNWGLWFTHIQSTTRILNIWDAMRGDVLNTTPPTCDLLANLSLPGATTSAAEIAAYTAAKAIWSKKDMQGLGLIHATISNVIWQKHQSLGTAKDVLDALEAKFGAVGGAQTCLQLVNMVKFSIYQFDGFAAANPSISGQL